MVFFELFDDIFIDVRILFVEFKISASDCGFCAFPSAKKVGEFAVVAYVAEVDVVEAGDLSVLVFDSDLFFRSKILP